MLGTASRFTATLALGCHHREHRHTRCGCRVPAQTVPPDDCAGQPTAAPPTALLPAVAAVLRLPTAAAAQSCASLPSALPPAPLSHRATCCCMHRLLADHTICGSPRYMVRHLLLSHFLERCSDQRVGRAVGGVPVVAACSSRHRVRGSAVLGMEQRIATAMGSGGIRRANKWCCALEDCAG